MIILLLLHKYVSMHQTYPIVFSQSWDEHFVHDSSASYLIACISSLVSPPQPGFTCAVSQKVMSVTRGSTVAKISHIWRDALSHPTLSDSSHMYAASIYSTFQTSKGHSVDGIRQFEVMSPVWFTALPLPVLGLHYMHTWGRKLFMSSWWR